MAALCVVILFAGSLITVLDLSCAAFSSLIIVMAVIEIGGFYPWLVWLTVSVLGLLLLPDKFGSLVFCVFAGYYPILKQRFERLHPAISWILKITIFNVSLTVIIYVSKKLLGLPDAEIAFSIAVYATCNLVFGLYDIALTRLISLYFFKFRSKFKFFR